MSVLQELCAISPLVPPSRRTLLASLSSASVAAGFAAGVGAAGPRGGAAPPADPASASSVGIRPEDFGAVGDGVADDAPAIQRALDAVARRPFGGIVLLQPRTAYRCRSGLVLNASHTSLWGQALLDFSGTTGVCLRIDASSVARGVPANNYGRKGMISGAIHLRGPGRTTQSTGILFDAGAVATSAQMLVENMAISDCGTGIRFARRAYNSVFTRCEVFQCGTCIEWPTADDNAERNTLLGCALYNSDVAVRMANGAAGLYLVGCSIDYTQRLYDVAGGTIFATDCHHESSLWDDRPIRCLGDGALVRIAGGWMLNQARDWQARHVVEVGEGAEVSCEGVVLHDVAPVPAALGRASAWAIGAGVARIRHAHGFDLGRLPMRLQDGRTSLADPDFAAGDWQDPVWRTADTTLPITTRVGGERDNLRLVRVRKGDGPALSAIKAYGTTSPASFVLAALPVRGGEQVLAGFEVRRDPERPGRDGTVLVNAAWARIDGHDAARIPVITRLDRTATLTVIPETGRYAAITPLASRRTRLAPNWATHFLMVIDLVQAHQASFLFKGLWCDVI